MPALIILSTALIGVSALASDFQKPPVRAEQGTAEALATLGGVVFAQDDRDSGIPAGQTTF